MPGTAALAMIADHIRQFGAVKWFRRIVGLTRSAQYVARTERAAYEWRSDGTTETFSARPVLSYASLKVRLPCVKNMACRREQS